MYKMFFRDVIDKFPRFSNDMADAEVIEDGASAVIISSLLQIICPYHGVMRMIPQYEESPTHNFVIYYEGVK